MSDEPTKSLENLSIFLTDVIAKPEILDVDPLFKEFFFETLTPGVLKRLSKERSRDKQVRNCDLTSLVLRPNRSNL